MKFPRARLRAQRHDIPRIDAGAGHHADAACCLRDEFADQRSAGERIGLRSGSQHTFAAKRDDILERGFRFMRNVEGAMKCHAEIAGRHDQRAATIRIDSAIFIERTDHDAIAAERHARLDVALHRFVFGIAVNEIAGARSDQHVDRDANALARQSDLRIRRRESAEFERGTQFDAIGAALLRG